MAVQSIHFGTHVEADLIGILQTSGKIFVVDARPVNGAHNIGCGAPIM
jgi:hypothetical protein